MENTMFRTRPTGWKYVTSEGTGASYGVAGRVTVAAIAVAPMIPMPGMVSSPLACIIRAMLHLDPLIKRSEHRLQCFKLSCQA